MQISVKSAIKCLSFIKYLQQKWLYLCAIFEQNADKMGSKIFTLIFIQQTLMAIWVVVIVATLPEKTRLYSNSSIYCYKSKFSSKTDKNSVKRC